MAQHLLACDQEHLMTQSLLTYVTRGILYLNTWHVTSDIWSVKAQPLLACVTEIGKSENTALQGWKPFQTASLTQKGKSNEAVVSH